MIETSATPVEKLSSDQLHSQLENMLDNPPVEIKASKIVSEKNLARAPIHIRNSYSRLVSSKSKDSRPKSMLTSSNPNLHDLRYFREELPENLRKSRLISGQKFNEQIYGMKIAKSLKERDFLDYIS